MSNIQKFLKRNIDVVLKPGYLFSLPGVFIGFWAHFLFRFMVVVVVCVCVCVGGGGGGGG